MCFKWFKKNKQQEKVQEKPIEQKKPKIEEDPAEIERKKQKEYERMSKWGLESSQKIEKVEDPNGVEAVGIIQNRKGKVYLFGPNGFNVKPGDVVEIIDLAGEDKAVSVVIGNHMAPKERIVEPFKDIIKVLSRRGCLSASPTARRTATRRSA